MVPNAFRYPFHHIVLLSHPSEADSFVKFPNRILLFSISSYLAVWILS